MTVNICTSQPLYGGGSGVCVFFVCVYSFLLCWSPLDVVGAHFAVLGRLWASFWEPLGHLGLPRGSPGRHFGVPGAPLGRLGAIWATLGSQVELGMTWGPKWTSNSEQMALKYATCAQKVTSRNSAAAAAAAPYGPKVEQGQQLPTPLHSRRGLG